MTRPVPKSLPLRPFRGAEATSHKLDQKRGREEYPGAPNGRFRRIWPKPRGGKRPADQFVLSRNVQPRATVTASSKRPTGTRAAAPQYARADKMQKHPLNRRRYSSIRPDITIQTDHILTRRAPRLPRLPELIGRSRVSAVVARRERMHANQRCEIEN